MLKQITEDITSQLKDSNQIKIAGKTYNEIINYTYTLSMNDVNNLLGKNFKPNHPLDAEEREDIFKYFDQFDFSNDSNTRQAVFQPKYKEDSSKAACISAIQVLIRNGIYVNVFMRSSNFDQNWWYDQETFAMLATQIQNKHFNLVTEVNVMIGSLHKPTYILEGILQRGQEKTKNRPY